MTAPIANVEMAAAWDGDEGDDWASGWKRYDRSIRAYQERLVTASGIKTEERVLDIGCGNGESTRTAARAAVAGSAFGVDLSTRMIERARELAAAEDLANVTFERADAQVHPFERNAYDAAISRFGAMFFQDRRAAFRNICRALRPGGRVVMLAWQELNRNEWLLEIRAALAVGRLLPSPPPGVPGPFGLADREGVERDLQAEGFADVGVEGVEEPNWVGSDTEDAYRFIGGLGLVRGLLQDLDNPRRAAALESLRKTIAAHATADGVVFGSAAWLITAHRPGG